MRMKKLWIVLSMLVLFPSVAISLLSHSDESKADELYNAREELEYSPQARMARQEERNREIQFQRYQQQQYLQNQHLMEQESLANQVHHSEGRLDSKDIIGKKH
jgi:hypothetical protein